MGAQTIPARRRRTDRQAPAPEHACPTGYHVAPAAECYRGHGRITGCRCTGCRAANAARARRLRGRDHRRIDAAPARALLAALLDLGATWPWIADRTGLHEGHLRELRAGRYARTHQATLDAIDSVHRQVLAGDVHPPRIRHSTPDRPCQHCGRRERAGGSISCRTCQRHQGAAA